MRALEKSKQLGSRRSPSGWFYLAMTYWQQGDRAKARSSYGNGVQWMEKHNPRNEELVRLRAEATVLLGMSDHTIPLAKEEEHDQQRPKP
jgi:hypothetical protein